MSNLSSLTEGISGCDDLYPLTSHSLPLSPGIAQGHVIPVGSHDHLSSRAFYTWMLSQQLTLSRPPCPGHTRARSTFSSPLLSLQFIN